MEDMLTLAATGYLGYDAAGVVDEAGAGVTGVSIDDDVFGRGQNAQAEYAVLDAWAAKPPPIDWAVAAAASVAGETSERGLRLLGVKAGDTIFVDGGAGGVGAVAVQMALARGARVIASASEANQDYLREIRAIPVLYGEGVAARVRAAAGGPVDAVFDVAGQTPAGELISLVSEPSQVLSIANFAAEQAGARVTGRGADSRPMQALAEVAELLGWAWRWVAGLCWLGVRGSGRCGTAMLAPPSSGREGPLHLGVFVSCGRAVHSPPAWWLPGCLAARGAGHRRRSWPAARGGRYLGLPDRAGSPDQCPQARRPGQRAGQRQVRR